MSKPICLVFALLILTTILCNNSVCSQRGSWKPSVVCGCRIHHQNNILQCTKRHRPKTTEEHNKMIGCICRNRPKYLNEASKIRFLSMCRSNSQTAL